MTTRRRYRRRPSHGLVHVSRVLPEIFERIGKDIHYLLDDPPPPQRDLFDPDPDEDGET
jgi:hypothetical protein